MTRRLSLRLTLLLAILMMILSACGGATDTPTSAPSLPTNTTAPAAATNTTAPVAATDTTAPMAATDTVAPAAATNTTAPVAATNTTAPTAASSAGGSKTVHFLSIQTEDTGQAKIVGELGRAYQTAHPGVTYEYENVAQTDLQQRLQLLAGSNSLPTIFNVDSTSTLSQMVKAGQVLDIEQTFKDLGISDALVPAAVALLKDQAGTTGQEGLYTLPMELNIEGFWYNKKIFADNGLTAPTTWDDMLKDADTLNAKGIQPFSASGDQKWPLTRLIGGYAERVYGSDVMSRVASGALKLTDPGFIAAAQTVKDMATKGYFGPGVTTVDYDTAVSQFLTGKAAMFYMGSWELRDYNDATKNQIGADNIGMFNIPLVSGGKGTLDDWSLNAGVTASINKAQYDATLGDWMKSVFSQYGDTSMNELGAITGFKVNNMPSTVPPLTQFTSQQIGAAKVGFLFWEAHFNAKATSVSQDNVQNLVTDANYSATQYMTDLQAAIDSGQ